MTLKQLGQKISCGNTADESGHHTDYILLKDFYPHVFSLYSHRCIYIAICLHTLYLDKLPAVLEQLKMGLHITINRTRRYIPRA